MIPAGYMAKRVQARPDTLRATVVTDVYSLSSCISANFAGVPFGWRQNGYWLFNSPREILAFASIEGTDLTGMTLFYDEVHPFEFLAETGRWRAFSPDPACVTAVESPTVKSLAGFDVACFSGGSAAECSPMSRNGLATELPINEHCLLPTLTAAAYALNAGRFAEGEPGPHRIFAVHVVVWP